MPVSHRRVPRLGQGIDRDSVLLDPGAKELSVDLVLRAGKVTAATSTFGVRYPPVVLVHGIGSTADWEFSGPFLDELYTRMPSDFVLRVQYGVNGSDTTANRVSDLETCAQLLDATLKTSIENRQTVLARDWAFTRYDIVGHSQGGVILRYLAQYQNLTKLPLFRNADNLWRGRFDRAISIGSPHNGSLLYYYSVSLYLYGKAWFDFDKYPFYLFNAQGNEKLPLWTAVPDAPFQPLISKLP